jgi:hypothetical protein
MDRCLRLSAIWRFSSATVVAGVGGIARRGPRGLNREVSATWRGPLPSGIVLGEAEAQPSTETVVNWKVDRT